MAVFVSHSGPKGQFYTVKSLVTVMFTYCDNVLFPRQCHNNRDGLYDGSSSAKTRLVLWGFGEGKGKVFWPAGVINLGI